MFFSKNTKSIKRKRLAIILAIVVVFGIFIGSINPVAAFSVTSFAKGAVLQICGWVASLAISIIGMLVGIFIEAFIGIANYNHFIDSDAPPVVSIGWNLVRDLCNMLFIIGLMVIAFGTILKIQTYHARNLLPKLILMIILINFSKTITGILIDFAQVIMMTFVNSFKDSLTIVLTKGFLIEKMLDLSTQAESGFFGTVASMFLAVGMLIVACAVMLAYVVVLLMRVIMLWVLVILSPIAFLATILPISQRYSSAWWSALGKNLISGPLLAFFLWLSLTAISTTNAKPIPLEFSAKADLQAGLQQSDIAAGQQPTDLSKGATAVMTTQNIFNYVVTIALLLMGLGMTQSLGVMGGSFAGSMAGKLKSGALMPVKLGKWGAKKGALWGARGLDNLQMKGQRAILQKTPLGRWMTGRGKEEKVTQRRDALLASNELEKDAKLKAVAEKKGVRLKPVDDRIEELKNMENTIELGPPIENKDKILADIRKEKEEKNEERKRLEQPFTAEEEEINKDADIKEKAIKEDKENIYKRGRWRGGLNVVSQTGVTGNYRLWKKGMEDFSARRLKQYDVGKSGNVHDLASVVTTKGKEQTSFRYAEERAEVAAHNRAILDKTGGEADLNNAELMGAIKGGQKEKIIAAMFALAQNADLNEMTKGPVMRDFMRPYMQKALELQKTTTMVDKKTGIRSTRATTTADRERVMNDWNKGSASAGSIGLLKRHLLTMAAGGDENTAARFAKDLENVSAMKKQYQYYGATSVDKSTGKVKFEDMELDVHIDDGREVSANVDVTDAVTSAIEGKRANFSAQDMPHNGAFGAEGFDGQISYLDNVGKAILASLTGGTLRAAKRPYNQRPDFAKAFANEETVRQMYNWIKQIRAFENNEVKARFATKELANQKADMMEDFVKTMVDNATKKPTEARRGGGGDD